MESRDSVIAAVTKLPAQVQAVDYQQRGYHLEIFVTADKLRNFARLLRTGDFYLSSISGLHLSSGVEITYQFANYSFPCRLLAHVAADQSNKVPTICDIFQGADWHERETKDFFGVIFSDHPNLKPLLLAEDMEDLKPLLKKPAALKDRAGITRTVAAPSPAPAPAAKEDA